tara:strand:- start:984 stop:1754 length:771 start_codon:yes stop_codon:yes gene_type:complete
MKVVILAGGFGTRISEESRLRPKPMVEIGGKPILWHIMKIYSHYGLNDFIICLGYKGYLIKEYFSNYFLHNSNVTIDLNNNTTKIHNHSNEPWKITLVDTGENTMTGGRLKRVKDLIDDEMFCFTYGDGVSDININKLIEFHKSHKKLATVTAVKPEGRFGSISIGNNNDVLDFNEKVNVSSSWINAGFFVLSPRVIDHIDDDNSIWEEEPLSRLVSEKQIEAFRHENFWRPMDTLRDKDYLDKIIKENAAPWIKW